MRYKGYTTTMQFSNDDGVYYGVIEGIDNSVSFESNTAEEFEATFHEAVDDYEGILLRMAKREIVTRRIRVGAVIFVTLSGLLGLWLANYNRSVGNMLGAIYNALFVIMDTIILVSLCKN